MELNKWYKCDDGTLFYVTSECKEGHLYGYGFDSAGSWKYNVDEGGYRCAFNNVAKNYKTPVTKEEVEERLKQEAIKRGFVKGVEVVCLNEEEYISEIEFEDYYLDEDCDEVLWNSFCVDSSVIMKDGVWLEIENDKALVEDVIEGTETTDEVSPISLSSIFSSREKEFKKTLKYLLKKDIILTPKQYKKLWKKF